MLRQVLKGQAREAIGSGEAKVTSFQCKGELWHDDQGVRKIKGRGD